MSNTAQQRREKREDSASIRAFAATIVAIHDLNPQMRRITLGGESLDDFATDRGATWDLRIKLLIPPGRASPPAVHLLNERSIGADGKPQSWYETYTHMPQSARGVLRTYTVRAARLGATGCEIDLDFVLHDHTPWGPAAAWIRKVCVGDSVVFFGPSASSGRCLGVEYAPGSARRILLMGDETALPAIGGILRDCSPQARVETLIEVPDEESYASFACEYLEGRQGKLAHDVTWLVRGGRPYGELLLSTIRGSASFAQCMPRLSVPCEDIEELAATGVCAGETLWDTPQNRSFRFPVRDVAQQSVYVWIAGEAGLVIKLRRYLVQELGMNRATIAFMGYWKQGAPQG